MFTSGDVGRHGTMISPNSFWYNTFKSLGIANKCFLSKHERRRVKQNKQIPFEHHVSYLDEKTIQTISEINCESTDFCQSVKMNYDYNIQLIRGRSKVYEMKSKKIQ